MLTPRDCQCGHAHGDDHEDDGSNAEDTQTPSLAFQLWHPLRLIVMVITQLLF
ncbi:hypothetical protein Plhal304r1_c021g0074531 [Plasmopara halstedii]